MVAGDRLSSRVREPMGGSFCISSFPARDLPFAFGAPGIVALNRLFKAPFLLTRSREAVKGNATDSVRCSVFDQVTAGGSLRSLGFPARAQCWGCLTGWVADLQGNWPSYLQPLSPVSWGRVGN